MKQTIGVECLPYRFETDPERGKNGVKPVRRNDMKTIFKKSLALAVCAALCLTAFMGCLTVSATGTATAVISTASVANGTSSTSLTVTITGSANIAGARFDIVADATKLTLGTATVAGAATVETSTPATDTTRFVVVADNVSTGLSPIVVTLPYTILNPTTAGDINVTFGDTKEVANVDETLMTVTPTNGKVTVEAAHVHDFSGAWQSNANYHWKVCPADDATGDQAAHTFGAWTTTVQPGCTTTGTKTRTCSVCGYVESDTVAATGHTPASAVQEDYVAPTCVDAGSYNSVVYCSVCEAKISTTPVVVPATGEHTAAEAVEEDYVAPTCGVAGSYNSVVYCSVCNAKISTTPVVVPATGAHTAAEAVQENVVAATCGVAGSYESVVYCSVCSAEISRTPQTIPATGEHTWGEYTSDAEGHSRTCSVCEAVDAGEHDGDPCSVCGYTAPVAEPTVNSSLVFANGSAGLASTSVQFSFRLRQNLFTSYADFDMVLVPGKYDTTTFNLIEDVTPIVVNKAAFSKPNSTFYSYTYTDLQLYELGLDIQYYIKCYDAGGNYVARSEYFSISPADAIITLIGQTANAKMKTALVDLLVVCDEACQLFGKAGSDLANADSVLEGVDLSLATASTPDLTLEDGFTAANANFGTATSSV